MLKDYLSIFLIMLAVATQAQVTTPADTVLLTRQPQENSSMYRVNPWISGGIALVGLYTNTTGLERLRNAPMIPEGRLNRLNEDDLIGLDRVALRQNPDKAARDKAQNTSDLLLYSGAISPILLFLDRSIRRQWLDVSLIYLESQAATSNFYTWGPLGPTFAERLRPAAYYTELSLDERSAGNNRNSLYSGHVASTATGWFFLATVYSDFHPELGGKKFLLYGLASIPVVVISVNRVRALRHFPTDTIVGGIVGGAIGVLIPIIHKRTNGRLSVGAVYDSEAKGMSVVWKW